MDDAGFLVSQIKQVQDRVFQKMLKKDGIDNFNGPQGRILSVLWQEDDLSISELARRTSLARTTLTSMLDRMVEKGHIRRVFDEVDRRQVRITLTDKAKGLKQAYIDVTEKMSEVLYKGLSEREIFHLKRLLDRILKNVKEYE